MATKAISYVRHFKIDQIVGLSIKVSEGVFLNRNAGITAIRENRLRVELYGAAPSPAERPASGAEVVLIGRKPWMMYRCSGTVEEVDGERGLVILLRGKVRERQLRQFFRLDINAPVLFTLPSSQNSMKVAAEWRALRDLFMALPEPEPYESPEGLTLVSWRGNNQITAKKINLSGGGIRFTTGEHVEPGTFALLTLILPTRPLQAIPIAAEVLKCQEITLSTDRNRAFSLIMRFRNIEEVDREAIISYMIREERRFLRRKREEAF